MAYCKYLRKSRADLEAEARGEGETLARHSRILDELAARLHLTVSAEYREIVTGESIEARPQMRRLLDDVSAGRWEGVLVVEIERLARGDTIDQGVVAKAFKYSETKIITPMKTYDPTNEFDEEYFEFGLFMSRREYQTIRRRMQAGRLSATKEGKYVGNIPPYGYRRVRLSHDSGFTLGPEPKQAEAVRYIFQAFAGSNGPALSMGQIVKRLNASGIPPAKRETWTTETVSAILHNPVYIGKVKWNSRPEVKRYENGRVVKSRPRNRLDQMTLADGLHPPLVTDSDWETVQARLRENLGKFVPEQKELKNPLAGLLVCGLCGHRMSRQATSDPERTMMICRNNACKNVGVYLSEIEESVLQAIAHWLQGYQGRLDREQERYSAQFASGICRDSLKQQEKELETLKVQQGALYDLLEQGIYTPEVFQQRNGIITQRIVDTQEKIASLRQELADAEQREEAFAKIIPAVQDALHLYRTAETAQEKNDLLRTILEKAVYVKKETGTRRAKSKFSLTIYPKLPR